MEFNFSFQRLLLLAAFFTVFAILGGFSPPFVSADSIFSPHGAAKAWRQCVIIFTAGAICASVVDHFVGNIDRSNIRIIYIIVGAVLMIVSCVWIRGLGDVVQGEQTGAQPVNKTMSGFYHIPS